MQHGDLYREAYPDYSFEQKQHVMNLLLKQHVQLVKPATFLLQCLTLVDVDNLNVAELGGYDGTHAYQVLKLFPHVSWVNYDISQVAANLTRPELADYNYRVVVLNKPFTEYDLGNFNLFYSSKTLEHMRFEEVGQTLTAAQTAKHQVHVVDWFWKDDTHVIEQGRHDNIVVHLETLGYKMRRTFKNEYQSRIFCSKTKTEN